jgi:hypothetical protein
MPVWGTYIFQMHSLCVTVHLTILLMFIYCRYKSAVGKLIKNTDVAMHRVVSYPVFLNIQNFLNSVDIL